MDMSSSKACFYVTLFLKPEFWDVDLQNQKLGAFLKNFNIHCVLSQKVYYKVECFTCQKFDHFSSSILRKN